MHNNLLQTHVDAIYVCFLPSQVSQIRPLIDKHLETIEAQYPLQQKTAPYLLHYHHTAFLFIPVNNLKHFTIQDAIDLSIQIDLLDLPDSPFQSVDMHFALLEKYLPEDLIAIIHTALKNKLECNLTAQLNLSRLKELPANIVERTLCLARDDDVKMYEYIPDNAEILYLLINPQSEINTALLSTLFNLNVGMILITYHNKEVQPTQRIALNGLTVMTHDNPYYNILFDALFYAKQYRMKVVLLCNDNNKKSRLIKLRHHKTKLLERLVSQQFEVEYQYKRLQRLTDHIDLNTNDRLIPQSVIPDIMELTLQNYPVNQGLYTYLFSATNKSLDE